RDFHVTGVQTCALPICHPEWRTRSDPVRSAGRWKKMQSKTPFDSHKLDLAKFDGATEAEFLERARPRLLGIAYRILGSHAEAQRSEERRVGKECRCRGT